jgi:hypothetical protein
MLPHRKPTEMTILLRERPRRFGVAVCIAAVAVLGAETAAAQNCFLFFCPPGSQPDWQGTPLPDRQGEPVPTPSPIDRCFSSRRDPASGRCRRSMYAACRNPVLKTF